MRVMKNLRQHPKKSKKVNPKCIIHGIKKKIYNDYILLPNLGKIHKVLSEQITFSSELYQCL